MSVKIPQDHKAKATKVENFTFEGRDGETYELPGVAELMEATDVAFGDFLDAVDSGDAAVALFSMRLLNKADLPADVKAALRALPFKRGLEVAAAWQTHAGAGVSLPE